MEIGLSLACCGLVLGLIWLVASLLIRSGVGYSGVDSISTMSRGLSMIEQKCILQFTQILKVHVQTLMVKATQPNACVTSVTSHKQLRADS